MIKYQIDSLSIELSEFINNEDKSYRYLFDNSYHIDMKFFDVLNEFMCKRITDPSKMIISHSDCVYGEASRNYRFRFIILKSNDDYVLVTFKIVDPRTASIKNYFSITNLPISYEGKDVKEVMEALRLYECIKSIEIPCNADEYDRNNYYNIIDDFSEMKRAKWRSKRGINKLSSLIDVNYHSENLPDIRDLRASMFDMWCKFKGKKVTDKTDKGMLELALKMEKACIITFWYNRKLLGITIGTPTYGNYITIYTQKSLGISNNEFLSEYLEEDNMEIVRDINKYLGSYVQYCINRYCFEDMGFKAVFYTGDQKDENLRRFKRIYYKNTVNYKRVPLEDYFKEV